MLFAEQDAPHLKKWIVKRLEDTSDADADVLADYVLALLRHDGEIVTVRRLCEEEIPDFVKEDSSIFVRDVFHAIKYKSYLPGAPPAPKSFIPSKPPPTFPAAMSGQSHGADAFMANNPPRPQNGTKKRSFGDLGDTETNIGRQDQFGGDMNGRLVKQPRRGSNTSHGARFDTFGNSRGGRQMQPSLNQLLPSPGFPSLPPMPTPPPGMPPIDPSNPLAAMLTMQAMGFPVPGIPPYQQSSPPTGQSNALRAGPSASKRGRCRDYDNKGFCARGNTCMFEHGTDSIYIPHNAADEYDPANSALMPGIEANPRPIMTAPPLMGLDSFRGNDRGRGRGRGFRGDRGGSNGAAPSRRGGRAEFSSDRPNHDRTKTSIVVENIPEETFSEDAVREFFSEFGSITEITMKPYKRLALVKYEDWAAAKAAYNSPKVIFDNRFVKVYWYINDESLPRAPSVSGAATNGAVDHGNGTPAPMPERKPSEPQIDMEQFARKQVEIQKAHEEKTKKKAEMEVAQKELEKRQEELLKKQAEERRKLTERLAAKTNKAGASAATDKDETVLVSGAKPGSQTELLKAQLAALEAEAKSLGLDTALSDDTTWSSRGRGYARGGYRGRATFVPRGRGFDRGGYRGRGGAPFGGAGAVYKLDNRPKKIAVTGVDFTSPDKDESLRQYLLGVGEYTEIDATPKSTSITFKDRFTAEKFMHSLASTGEIPSAGPVHLEWVKNPNTSAKPINKPPLNPPKAEPTDDIPNEEGDATMQESSHVHGTVQGQDQQQELDYDIADDNDWGVQ